MGLGVGVFSPWLGHGVDGCRVIVRIRPVLKESWAQDVARHGWSAV